MAAVGAVIAVTVFERFFVVLAVVRCVPTVSVADEVGSGALGVCGSAAVEPEERLLSRIVGLRHGDKLRLQEMSDTVRENVYRSRYGQCDIHSSTTHTRVGA